MCCKKKKETPEYKKKNEKKEIIKKKLDLKEIMVDLYNFKENLKHVYENLGIPQNSVNAFDIFDKWKDEATGPPKKKLKTRGPVQIITQQPQDSGGGKDNPKTNYKQIDQEI